MKNTFDDLAFSAMAARASAYSPYSSITVGAALLGKSGKIYLGSNVENASYSLTICAERVAFSKAISEGEREFTAIAIAGGKCGEDIKGPFPPCGACRQVMAEFCGPDFAVILADEESFTVKTLAELLPCGFDEKFL
jgi:cytidine deaminase